MKYVAMTGLEYSGKRVEEGEIVDDLPRKSVKWLLEQGLVRPAEPDEGGET